MSAYIMRSSITSFSLPYDGLARSLVGFLYFWQFKNTMENSQYLEKNLQLMASQNQGGLLRQLFRGTMYPCPPDIPEHGSFIDVEFYLSSSTGEIMYFGDAQHVPPQVRLEFQKAELKIGVNVNEGGFPQLLYKIIGMRCITDRVYEDLFSGAIVSDSAKRILQESIDEFNKKNKDHRTKR